MTLQWLITAVAALAGLTAWSRSRRLARRVERLTESYWELRYEHGQLRARLNRLDPEDGSPSEPARQAGTTAFVPLSSLKR